jgi:hypothetical protein
MIDQLLDVEQFGVDRRSWVVTELDAGLTLVEVEEVETTLLSLPSVDGVTASTERELSLIPAIDTPVSDPETWRTLGLDGELHAATVSQMARNVLGVAAAHPKVAISPDSNLALIERVVPVVTAIMLAVALILLVQLVVARARTVASGSVLMRWLRLVVAIAAPVVVTVLGATLIAAAVWPSLAYPVISRTASHLLSSTAVARPGLDLALLAGLITVLLSLLAVIMVEHPGPRHQK